MNFDIVCILDQFGPIGIDLGPFGIDLNPEGRWECSHFERFSEKVQKEKNVHKFVRAKKTIYSDR